MRVSRVRAAAVLGSVLLVAALVLSVLALLASRQGDVVKAQRFEVVDSRGATRVIMTTLEGSRPSVSLLDDAGEARAWLFLSRDGSPNMVLQNGSRLIFADKNGDIRALERLDTDGSPVISFADASGKIRVVQRLDGSGTPLLEFYGPDGKAVWTAK